MQACLGPCAQTKQHRHRGENVLSDHSCLPRVVAGWSLLFVDRAWSHVLVPNDGGLAAEQVKVGVKRNPSPQS